jgi:hypothetical protein
MEEGMYQLPGGVTRTKPVPSLVTLNLSNFQREIDWIKGFIEESLNIPGRGCTITSAWVCPYLERCYFYDGEDLIAVVEHKTVERLYEHFLLKTAEDDYKKTYNQIIARSEG